MPYGHEAMQRMFFEFFRGNVLRMRPPQASDLDERFEKALRSTAMAWRQAVDRRLRRLGVSRVSWMTMAAATQARAPLSQSMLADTLAISPASLVQTIDRLVRDGLVKRESSASDRRRKCIVVTDAGIDLCTLINAEVAVLRRQVLTGIELVKLVQLTELLEKLHGPLRRSSSPQSILART
jgi:MarR family transcriptional regulator, transcriptional regulator for hemolysin